MDVFCELPAPPFKLVSATDSTHVRVAGTLVLALAFNLRGAFPLTGLVLLDIHVLEFINLILIQDNFGNDDSGSAGCGDTKPAEAKASILVKRR